MKKLTTHDKGIMKEVMDKCVSKYLGQAITEEAWNVAYQIVWADHAIDSIAWKINNIFVDA